jgi:hypothetical protein
MFGTFLMNLENQVCFAQMGQHKKITYVRLAESDLCIMGCENGHEEMFTDEIVPQIWDAMKESDHILIAHLDAAGNLIEEYNAPIQK